MKFRFIIKTVLFCILLQILSVGICHAETNELFFKDYGARKIEYIEESDLFVIMGTPGVYTSRDGNTWNRKAFVDNNKSIYDLAAGNDKVLLIKGGWTETSIYVSDMAMNFSKEVFSVVEENGAKYNLILRPEICFDPYTQTFLCGGLVSKNGSYTNLGLYRSTGEITESTLPNGNPGSVMVWEKVDLAGYDIFNPTATYTSSVEYMFRQIMTDGNGHIILAKNTDWTTNSTMTTGNYNRSLILMDETEQPMKLNRINVTGLLNGAYIDEYANIILCKDNDHGKIYTLKFSTAMGYTKDAANVPSGISNINGLNGAIYCDRFVSDGKYLIGIPTHAVSTTELQQNDVRIVSYNEKNELKGNYTTFVNNSTTLGKIIGTTSAKNNICDITTNGKGLFVAITGYASYSKAETHPAKVIIFNTKDLSINSQSADENKIDRTEFISFAENGGLDVCAIEINNADATVVPGEEIQIESTMYDSQRNPITSGIAWEVVDYQDGAETFLDFSKVETDGLIKVKTDYSGSANMSVTIRASRQNDPSTFAEKEIMLDIMSPITCNITSTKESGFAEGDEVTINAYVANYSDSRLKGYVITCIKKDKTFSNFTLIPIDLATGQTTTPALTTTFTVSEGDYENAELKMYLINEQSMSNIK